MPVSALASPFINPQILLEEMWCLHLGLVLGLLACFLRSIRSAIGRRQRLTVDRVCPPSDASTDGKEGRRRKSGTASKGMWNTSPTRSDCYLAMFMPCCVGSLASYRRRKTSYVRTYYVPQRLTVYRLCRPGSVSASRHHCHFGVSVGEWPVA